MTLEFSQYLESYLWHHFTPERVSPAYLMSIVLMVNEKWRQGVPPWQVFVQAPGNFPQFMHLLMEACTSSLKARPVFGVVIWWALDVIVVFLFFLHGLGWGVQHEGADFTLDVLGPCLQ